MSSLITWSIAIPLLPTPNSHFRGHELLIIPTKRLLTPASNPQVSVHPLKNSSEIQLYLLKAEGVFFFLPGHKLFLIESLQQLTKLLRLRQNNKIQILTYLM